MRINSYKYPESSFLSIEKDMGILVDLILKNENLKKMLYYTTKDCLKKPKLSEDESLDLFNKNIKLVPKLEVDKEVLNYLFISFDNFTENDSNPEFRNNLIEFDILCHFDQWQMVDFKLRPYRIAAEIDSMLRNKRLTGIGEIQFLGASQIIINDEFGGLCLLYQAIHGGEDKKQTPNPNDEIELVDNFNAIFNDEQ
jgi:hypothetical protein